MEIDDLYARIAQLELEKAEKDHRIAQIQREKAEKDHRIAQIQREKDEKDHRIAQIQREKDEKDHRIAEVEHELCIEFAKNHLQRNKSETPSTFVETQDKDTGFIAPNEFFSFIKETGQNEVDEATVTKCYQSFLDKKVSKPTKDSKEVTREKVGTVHYYFNEMFGSILSTLESIPHYRNNVDKIHLGYEEALAPSKHIPDYTIRDKRELNAGLAQTRLIIELKRENRASKGKGITNLIDEGLSDSISYGNAVMGELLRIKQHQRADKDDYIGMSIVSLALTPVELTAVRVYSVKGEKTNFVFEQVSTRTKANRTTLPLHSQSNSGTTYGYGFKLLVDAFNWSSLLSSWQSSPLTEVVLSNMKVLKLSYRLGMGGSSDTYEASDLTAVKIRHNPRVDLSREALIQNRVSLRQPANEAPHVPAVISFSEEYIQMQPCGVPLSVLVNSLFAHRKLLSLQTNPDSDELLRTTVLPFVDAPPPSRPVGLLVLAFLVLQHVSEALRVAHDEGVVHSDLRIGNVVLASWSSQDGTFVKQPVLVSDRDIDAPSPCFNTALLVDWGNALHIGIVTESLPGNLSFCSDRLLNLDLLSTNKGTLWTPQSADEWESLAYLYWDIASPVLAQCPWRIDIAVDSKSDVINRRSLLKSEHTGVFERSVLTMVEHVQIGGRDLVSCVDKKILYEDYMAMMNDPTMPFQLNVDNIEDFCS